MKKNSLLTIIAAAGVGKRFLCKTPKQYAQINGHSIIERALKPFINSSYVSEIIIAISKDDNLIKSQDFYNSKKIKYVIGGATRQESINNALHAAEKEYIFGTQFHPEKSDKLGLKIIDNFINI